MTTPQQRTENGEQLFRTMYFWGCLIFVAIALGAIGREFRRPREMPYTAHPTVQFCMRALNSSHLFLDEMNAVVIRRLKKAAEGGKPEAQIALANHYYSVRPYNYTEGAKWLRKAAAQGHVDAQMQLAQLYEYGRGVSKIPDLALKWYTRAAEQGGAWEQAYLAQIYRSGGILVKRNPEEENNASALQWYLKAAEQGYGSAQYWLGVVYNDGKGVQDFAKAMHWYLKAAKQKGDGVTQGLAEYRIGMMYDKGQGVGQDYLAAVRWYTKASEKHLDQASLRLGEMYEGGIGVTKNLNTAIRWYKKAGQFDLDSRKPLERLAAEGNKEAQKALEEVRAMDNEEVC
jgi:TPR repeat protein